MTVQQSSSDRHQLVRRLRRVRWLAPAVAVVAATLTLGTTSPAQAGLPDAGMTDFLRTPVWTSITMTRLSPRHELVDLVRRG